jgi:hypothetical protein
MNVNRWAGPLFLFALGISPTFAVTLEQPQGKLRVEVHGDGAGAEETIAVRMGGVWTPALSVAASPVRIKTPAREETCALRQASPIERGLLLTGECTAGGYEQRIVLSPDESDVLDVTTRVTLHHDAAITSVEDRYYFMPERHLTVTAEQGPLDFVWSQKIKSEADDLIPTYGFKSPAVMMQQGAVFAALMPQLSLRQVVPLALDLDVTSGPRPWMSFGQIPVQPHGHSYFRRAKEGHPKVLAGTVQYSYSILASEQPARLGYRRVVRRLWEQSGHPALLNSPGLQQNVIRHELRSFNSWRKQAWEIDANKIYLPIDCGGKHCGTLPSNRNISGDWQHTQPDAWFNAWFQTLRTAYGWYLYGRQAHDLEAMDKAESVLNLALSAPQQNGAFPTIYMVNEHKWFRDDGWAGYEDDYHSFCMSWTAYWMLRWAVDLVPQRSAEVLHFVKAYGDFLLQHQLPSGVIPSWYNSDLQPRAEFRDFNAETAPSALFLATLGSVTKDQRYIAAAEKAMAFVEREVVPRQRWFDFETFLSCARKDYDFYDKWTAQFPQNNLAEIQAPAAWLALYRVTGKREYLEEGMKSMDYLLLTQQVWSNPSFSPKLLGGFTTQNTDAEWSDARQGYAAVVLCDYFRATGNAEYLERAVAAARSTFAVAPWENWAHTGYIDEPGALTGFHWGTGSAMTSVEIMAPRLGDAFIDLKQGDGAGFDECSLRNLKIQGTQISFDIESPPKERSFVVRFDGVDPSQRYRITWNGHPVREISGRELSANGFRTGPLVSSSVASDNPSR